MKSKYVVGMARTEDHGLQLAAVVFPDCMVHSHVAKRLFYGVESAGFVEIYQDDDAAFCVGVRCYGRSESLELDSDPERDAELVRAALALKW
jgi:hypothetical protein